jgi:tRNA threonylcarbamoyladenosine biosynthesis protein TsaE
MKIVTNSEKETFDLAAKLGVKAKGGEVYALSGDLGAGKTVFVRGFCFGLGIKRGVNSPTFVLMKIHKVRGHKNIKEVCHIDAYRLKSADDLEAIGALDYFGKKDTVCFVEWPERVDKIFSKARQIRVEQIEDDSRKIEIKEPA